MKSRDEERMRRNQLFDNFAFARYLCASPSLAKMGENSVRGILASSAGSWRARL
jgi:hypothetical protein